MSRAYYDFGRFRLHPARRMLCDRASGEAIPLTSRGFDTLLCLVERRGELVSKAELLKIVWPNSLVEENNLNQSLVAVRRALGEQPGEHRFIVNVTGRGYQFIAPVSESNDEETGAGGTAPHAVDEKRAGLRPNRARWLTLAAGAFAAASALTWWLMRSHDDGSQAGSASSISSVAVLSFENLTGDPENAYLGDGIAEEVIHALARIPNLKVPARTSTFSYRGRAVDVRTIARDLGVHAVVEGSLRSAGEQIRVTVQLADGRTGYHLWSQSFERNAGDLLAMQDEIAANVVAALDVKPAQNVAPAQRAQGTDDVEAWRLHTQADALLFRKPTESNLATANRLLDEAIARDPDYSRAWSTRAFTRLTARVWYAASFTMQEVQHDAERGVALDPMSGNAHAVLGLVLAHCNAWVEAEDHWRRAIVLAPDDPSILARSADQSLRVGHVRQGVEKARRAQSLAPADPELALRRSLLALVAGADDEARKYADLATSVGWNPDVPPLSGIIATLAMRNGEYALSLRYALAGTASAPEAVRRSESLRLAYAAVEGSGNSNVAVRALERDARDTLDDPPDLQRAWVMISWLVRLGAVESAHEAAAGALDRSESTGMSGLVVPALIWNDEMTAFRRDHRFQSFAGRLGLITYWQRYGAPDACELHGESLACR
jgi:TolB-like protein/DNA-binding winged helix-turn-helix (wHTH) protein